MLGGLGYGSTSCTFQWRGHVKCKISGAFDLTYGYDGAERVVDP